jgi:predicted amidophosphoribosyltransferase
MNCPTCGAGLVPDAKFCGACGTPTATAAAPQPPAPQPAAPQPAAPS